jgi:hypothetical protein
MAQRREPAFANRRDRTDARVAAWVDARDPAELFVSVVTVLELEMGVLAVERRDALQGTLLRRWLEERVLPAFEHRILPIDLDVARRGAPVAGLMTGPLPKRPRFGDLRPCRWTGNALIFLARSKN